MMKTVFGAEAKSENFCCSKGYVRQIEKEINLVNFKFYQKFFVLLISFSTILIFSESPRELGNICESYNSRKVCSVW